MPNLNNVQISALGGFLTIHIGHCPTHDRADGGTAVTTPGQVASQPPGRDRERQPTKLLGTSQCQCGGPLDLVVLGDASQRDHLILRRYAPPGELTCEGTSGQTLIPMALADPLDRERSVVDVPDGLVPVEDAFGDLGIDPPPPQQFRQLVTGSRGLGEGTKHDEGSDALGVGLVGLIGQGSRRGVHQASTACTGRSMTSAVTPIPMWLRMRSSISVARSGLSFRKVRAFSLP